MNKRSKRYTDEFKMLILELLEDGRAKKSLENEYGVATATIRKWEKKFKGIIDKKYNANEALNEIMALKRKLQQEMEKNKKLEKDLEQKELDIDILKKASAILMKENQIKSIIHKKFRNYNKSDDMKETARNILKRNFDTEKLNEKWVSDITYIWIRKDGRCYLSSIMDLHSRRIISHKAGKFMDIKLVVDTLKMAIYKRVDITDLIIHTDRGSQYMSEEYHKFCAKKA